MPGTSLAGPKGNKPVVLLCGVAIVTAAYLLLSRGKSNKDEKDIFRDKGIQDSGEENHSVSPNSSPVGNRNRDTPTPTDSSTEASSTSNPPMTIDPFEKDIDQRGSLAKEEDSQAERLNKIEKIEPASSAEIEELEKVVEDEAEVLQPEEIISTPAKIEELEDMNVKTPVSSPTEKVEAIEATTFQAEVVEDEEVVSISTKTEEFQNKMVEEPEPEPFQTERIEAIDATKNDAINIENEGIESRLLKTEGDDKEAKELAPSQTATAEVVESLEEADVVEQKKFPSTIANTEGGKMFEQSASSSPDVVDDKTGVPEKVALLPAPVSKRESEVEDEVAEKKESVTERKVEDRMGVNKDVASTDKAEVATEIAIDELETLLPNEVLASLPTNQDDAGAEPFVESTLGGTPSSSGDAMMPGDIQTVITTILPKEDIIVHENHSPAPPDTENSMGTESQDILDLMEKDKESPSIATAMLPATPLKKKKRRRKKKKNGATVSNGDGGGISTTQTTPTPKNLDENQNTANNASSAQIPNTDIDASSSASVIASKKALKNMRKRENRKKKNKTLAQTAAAKEIQDFKKSQENKTNGTPS